MLKDNGSALCVVQLEVCALILQVTIESRLQFGESV